MELRDRKLTNQAESLFISIRYQNSLQWILTDRTVYFMDIFLDSFINNTVISVVKRHKMYKVLHIFLIRKIAQKKISQIACVAVAQRESFKP